MTFFGKTLVFLNLVFGIGAAIASTALYTNRPPWHDDLKDEPVARGHAPVTFKQLEKDIAAQSAAASLANVNWGTAHKALETAEAMRVARHRRMFGTNLDGVRPPMSKGLLDYAREGGLTADGGAFLNLVEDSNTRLLNLNPDTKTAGVVVNGPDEKPLKGTETLFDQFVKDSAEVETQAALSKKLRAQQQALNGRIVVLQNQIYKQQDIRDNQLVEAARLEAFEVNATEHRGTVTRRRNQLIERLAPFRSLEKK
jgi:hypothetical protein